MCGLFFFFYFPSASFVCIKYGLLPVVSFSLSLCLLPTASKHITRTRVKERRKLNKNQNIQPKFFFSSKSTKSQYEKKKNHLKPVWLCSSLTLSLSLSLTLLSTIVKRSQSNIHYVCKSFNHLPRSGKIDDDDDVRYKCECQVAVETDQNKSWFICLFCFFFSSLHC